MPNNQERLCFSTDADMQLLTAADASCRRLRAFATAEPSAYRSDLMRMSQRRIAAHVRRLERRQLYGPAAELAVQTALQSKQVELVGLLFSEV